MKDLRAALSKVALPAALAGLAYELDVTPSGGDALVVYFIVSKGASRPNASSMREIEHAVRKSLRDALDGAEVYFRWRTSGEHRAVKGPKLLHG